MLGDSCESGIGKTYLKWRTLFLTSQIQIVFLSKCIYWQSFTMSMFVLTNMWRHWIEGVSARAQLEVIAIVNSPIQYIFILTLSNSPKLLWSPCWPWVYWQWSIKMEFYNGVNMNLAIIATGVSYHYHMWCTFPYCTRHHAIIAYRKHLDDCSHSQANYLTAQSNYSLAQNQVEASLVYTIGQVTGSMWITLIYWKPNGKGLEILCHNVSVGLIDTNNFYKHQRWLYQGRFCPACLQVSVITL